MTRLRVRLWRLAAYLAGVVHVVSSRGHDWMHDGLPDANCPACKAILDSLEFRTLYERPPDPVERLRRLGIL